MTGRVYGYVRVSTIEQKESGLSIAAQSKAIVKIGENDLWGTSAFPDDGSAPFLGCYTDAKSAYTTKLFDRPAGKALLKVLLPGDTIIASRLDRLCRNVADFGNLANMARQNNWNIICASPPIDLTNANGRAMANFYATVAEWESDQRSERIRAALARKTDKSRKKRSEEKEVSESSEYRPTRQEQPEEPKSQNKIYLYTRVSHRSSVASGLGLKDQAADCLLYAGDLAEKMPQLTDGGLITDAGVSAVDKPFASRVNGGRLNRVLVSGDHVIVQKPCRMFRDQRDSVTTMMDFASRGVVLHFAQSGLSTDDPTGCAVIGLMVFMAQAEAQMMSMRAKECRAELESLGKYAGGSVAPFWRLYRSNHKKKLILDRSQIVQFRAIEGLRRHGMTVDRALYRIEELIAKREGRPALLLNGVRRAGKWRSLPESRFPAGANGLIHPLWTRRKHKTAVVSYEETMVKWRKQSREDKARIKELTSGQH